jgi:hypothetical protein
MTAYALMVNLHNMRHGWAYMAKNNLDQHKWDKAIPDLLPEGLRVPQKGEIFCSPPLRRPWNWNEMSKLP